MILSYLSTVKAEKFFTGHDFLDEIVTHRPVHTSIDWYRATNTDLNKFQLAMKKFTPLLVGVGFNFVKLDRGLGNYPMAYQIQFNGRVCGSICADDADLDDGNIGGMFDLTGAGCQLLQGRWDLWIALVVGLMDFGFNIKRLDVAADFKGSIWDEYKVNILSFNDLVNEGLLSTTSLGNKPDIGVFGSFSELMHKRIDSSTYDPKKHAVGGCTVNVGKRTSCSSWCLYEKGKEQAGKKPELYGDDRSLFSWIRIERRFSQGSGRSKKEIPYHFALCPDQAFIYECKGIEKFLKGWSDFQVSKGVDPDLVSDPEVVNLDRPSMAATVSLKRSLVHSTQQASRALRTMFDLGIDVQEWVKRAMGDETIKGFCSDFHQGFSLDDFLPRIDDDDPGQLRIFLPIPCVKSRPILA